MRVKLPNGVEIPSIGCGTWTYNDKEAEQNVLSALSVGYRLIDTAEYYGNEKGVGKAVKACEIPREELFVNSKVWRNHYGYNKTRKAFEKSLKRMGLEYLDSYLIHWPAVEKDHKNWRELNAETWRALEDLHEEGLVRVIGVSNFMPSHFETLLQSARIVPMLNQIEFHPGFMQAETVEWFQQHNVQLQAWSPFGRGEIFQNETLKHVAAVHQRSAAQVCLRWILQHGLMPIVKSANRERQAQNLMVDDFVLSDEEMKQIDDIPFFGKLGYDPETIRLR